MDMLLNTQVLLLCNPRAVVPRMVPAFAGLPEEQAELNGRRSGVAVVIFHHSLLTASLSYLH